MPAPITKGSPLTPLPMRVTVRQHERLQAARARDSYSVQEHVRRALDIYLDMIERTPGSTPPPALPPASLPTSQRDVQQPAPGDNARSVAKTPRKRVASRKAPKVVYR